MIRQPLHLHPRAFSLVEVLLAVFILGIGLIMVATVFPVGANWTRQSTESSIAQVVAQDALSVIQTHYGPGGNLNGSGVGFDALPAVTAGSTSPLSALPGLISANISPNERAYQFGSSQPFPATTPSNCTYFWTALARRTPVPPGQPATFKLKSYDLYILVFHKGAVEQNFITFPTGATEFPNCRAGSETYIPSVAQAPYATGAYNNATGTVTNAVPPVGQFGIGLNSGTVYRQGVTVVAGALQGVASPPINTTVDANTLYAPPPDGGTTGSPLVYVFQTTISQ